MNLCLLDAQCQLCQNCLSIPEIRVPCRIRNVVSNCNEIVP